MSSTVKEHIFRDLGHDDLHDDINSYPTTDHIEALADDKPVRD